MRIPSSARDAIHAVVETFNRTVGYRTLETHIVNALLCGLGTCEVTMLRFSGGAEHGGKRFHFSVHDTHNS